MADYLRTKKLRSLSTSVWYKIGGGRAMWWSPLPKEVSVLGMVLDNLVQHEIGHCYREKLGYPRELQTAIYALTKIYGLTFLPDKYGVRSKT